VQDTKEKRLEVELKDSLRQGLYNRIKDETSVVLELSGI